MKFMNQLKKSIHIAGREAALPPPKFWQRLLKIAKFMLFVGNFRISPPNLKVGFRSHQKIYMNAATALL